MKNPEESTVGGGEYSASLVIAFGFDVPNGENDFFTLDAMEPPSASKYEPPLAAAPLVVSDTGPLIVTA